MANCTKPFSDHASFLNFPSNENQECVFCQHKLKDHMLMTHPFYGGNYPRDYYMDDISADPESPDVEYGCCK